MNEENKDKFKAHKLLAGAGMIGASSDMILGKKTMYHGTSKANWDKIKDEGLRADKGGTGAASKVQPGEYVNASKNNIHATRFKPVANMYSNFGETPVKPKYTDILSEGKGKRVKMKMDYDKFKGMKIDNVGSDDISDIPKAFHGLAKNMAAKGNINVSPEEIIGSNARLRDRIKHTTSKLPSYIKNNPGRFGAGLALAGGGAFLASKSLKNKEAHQFHKEQIEKIAEEDNEGIRALKRGGGLYATAKGIEIANKARRSGDLDGIKRFYHNTPKENVKSIKREGIKSSHALDPGNVTSYAGIDKKDMSGKVYVGTDRMTARDVGSRRQQIADSGFFYKADPTESLLKSFDTQKTMKVNVPVKDFKAMKVVNNPENRGAKTVKEIKQKLKAGEIPSTGALGEAKTLNKFLNKNTVTIEGDIASKYIKGGQGYKSQTLKGVAKHIKENPKQFARGVGKAGLGIGLAAGGAKLMYDGYKRNKEANAYHKEQIEKMAAQAWKKNFANLSESAVQKLKDSGVFNQRKELTGLWKGTNNILKANNAKNVKETHKAVGHVMQNTKQKMPDIEMEDYRFAKSQLSHMGPFGAPDVSYKGSSQKGVSHVPKGVSNKVHKILKENDIDDVDKIPRGDRNSKRWVDGILARHEADEIRLGNKVMRSPKKTFDNYGDKVPLTNFASHLTPKVLMAESANTALAPAGAKKYMNQVRGIDLGGESEKGILKDISNHNYGKSPIFNKGQARKMENEVIRNNKDMYGL